LLSPVLSPVMVLRLPAVTVEARAEGVAAAAVAMRW
jgi:hypothetical protein